jgi:hypothetical protein
VADQHPLTALNGVTWREADINEATMTVFLFTMCVVSLLADARLYAPAEVKIPH